MFLQFFGCYFNLFRLMTKCGVLQNLLRKEHVHTFVNTGGDVRELDFRFFVGDKKIGAPFHGLKAFFTTPQLSVLDKVRLLTSCPQEDGLFYMYSLCWSLQLPSILALPACSSGSFQNFSNFVILFCKAALRAASWMSLSTALQSCMACGTAGPEFSGAGDLTSCQGPF